MPKTDTAWKNRITGTGEESPDQLLANPRNWRIHPKHQQDALDAVLGEVGWVQNIVVNSRTGHVVDGHLRVSLALRRDEKTVPVVYVDLSEAEEALILATIDPLSALAATDKDKLDELLREVETGSAELQKMLAELAVDNGLTYGATGEEVDAEPQIDRAAELQEQWKTERGHVWQLGNHRLMCGDSTDKSHVATLLQDCRPFLAVTDPPYGVEYDADWRNHALRADGSTSDGRAIGKVANDDRADWRAAWALFPGDVIYSWHPPGATSLIHAAALQDSGFTIRMQIIWAKNQFPIGRGDYHVKHEPCWYCVREGKSANFTEDRTQHTLWEIDKPHKSETGHSTQKPVECMAKPIRNHSGDVYDPFVGSGSTIIAAEQLNRRCFAMEIEPKYVAVCLQRYADATGKQPTLIEQPVAVAQS